jgi:VanZ family protein
VIEWEAMPVLSLGRPAASPVARFAPPLGWMILIAGLSSHYFGGEHTATVFGWAASWLLPAASVERLEVLHGAFRKLGHLVEYGVLCILWMRALAPGRSLRRTAALAFVLAVAYAGIDEARQSLAPNRTPSLGDVGIDAGGAGLAASLWRPGADPTESRRALGRLLGVLLLVVSLAAGVVTWRLGLPPWELAFAGLVGELCYLARPRPA